MGIHLLAAETAFATTGDAGDHHLVSLVEVRDGGANFVDHADTLVAQNAAFSDGGHVSFQNV